MEKAKYTIEEFDNLLINLKIKYPDKNQKPAIFKQKKIVLGFSEIENFVENTILGLKEFELNKEYSFEAPDKQKSYKLEILKVSKPSKSQRQDRKSIKELKQKNLIITGELSNSYAKIINLETEIQKQADEYKKLAGEFQQKAQVEVNKIKSQNYEQSQKEIEQIKKYALQDFFEEFLISLDNLEIAAKAGEKSSNPEVSAYTKGFTMLLSKIEMTLNSYGITKIIPVVGEIFDAHTQQIFDFETTNDSQPSETILKIKNIGYKLHDRVIKPALVIVKK